MLSSPVTSLKGVGSKVAEKLARINIRTVQDVLFHLPLRYQDRTRILPAGSLQSGMEAVIEVQVDHAEIAFGRRRMLLVHVSDGTGALLLRFFHFSAAQKNNLKSGTRLRCFGEARQGKHLLEMIHPEYSVLQNESQPVEDTLTAIYPVTEGLHQLSLRKISEQSLQTAAEIKDWLPDNILQSLNLPSLREALQIVHRPSPEVELSRLLEGTHPAQQRLAFEELLAHQLSLIKLREKASLNPAVPLQGDGKLRSQFLTNLPFDLTAAQQRVVLEIECDSNQSFPMMRLVQGDVGSGKTVVAALACLQAIEMQQQAALMAPTEILAEQHFKNFSAWFGKLGINVAWLSGKQKAAERREMLAKIIAGEMMMVVGTHALFQNEVTFNNLAMIVIDEQHRFGVHQRLALQEKGKKINLFSHQLIMTATPIPRTLAQTAYADLDLSVIDEFPPGRQPVTTVAMPNSKRAEVISRVTHACENGEQCYWVCTLVEESDALQCEAAENTYATLQAAFPQLNIGLVHGRMKSQEKEKTMQDFKNNKINLLVATTVIEVGVDVPNASLMIIENAERLGLSQLHQLRGRVGRGSKKSACVLMYQPPLSENGKKRIQAMRETNDGFRIAQIDLELRGPGELLGTKQTGILQFRIADLARDKALIPDVVKAAKIIMKEHPQIVNPLIERWLGEKIEYQRV
ncbi:MAG TPA: ATP-dependent DNA helicase RecG [Chromatiales bacterium]|nr:ATP-dependent DNA helicase RecG [Thiotrichales bacterium]HIP67152.1 ATP-dependent DNA helicase RecG [Chromatiales bacterium]